MTVYDRLSTEQYVLFFLFLTYTLAIFQKIFLEVGENWKIVICDLTKGLQYMLKYTHDLHMKLLLLFKNRFLSEIRSSPLIY